MRRGPFTEISALIPELDEGMLPEGLHSCTIDEVERAFGRFNRTDKRPRLTEKLKEYVSDVRRTGIASAVIVDGSYITKKPEPNDIDLILVLSPDLDLTKDPNPYEERIQSSRMVRRLYGFDVLTAVDSSETYREYINSFAKIRKDDPEQETSRSLKGLLRVEL